MNKPDDLVCLGCGQSPRYTYEGYSSCCNRYVTRRANYKEQRQAELDELAQDEERRWLHEYDLYGYRGRLDVA